MSKINLWVKQAHQPLSQGAIRLVAMMAGLALTGLILWDPTQFAHAIGGFGPVISPAMIWAICSTMIYGVGFVPRNWFWQVFFTPFLALPVLAYIYWLRFF
ncbi:cytochrome bd biosynthesis protein [Photobacterium jeanii]|uniref:Cytochrome bd biosynthesis protein n=1 Tax=Photobacterium jeanii TaxID=858640 RepID=A0A178KMG4_9GAMM|nr:cyd operon protein YbgE [Photobacterium jeanii]OAN18431.1 cytochrome bd biosynthesis protein [Photobacterium jeanii]PST91888.1 cyd operon protein YbgE [Photobacterium jeanii]